jgi:hypothetical protein
MPDVGWPLLLIFAGLIAALLGGFLFVSGFDRFRRDHPDAFQSASGQEMVRYERRMWGLPIGALILGPASSPELSGSSGSWRRRRLLGHKPPTQLGPVFGNVTRS